MNTIVLEDGEVIFSPSLVDAFTGEPIKRTKYCSHKHGQTWSCD